MARKAKAIVLDAWSVLAYFQGEPSGEQLKSVLADAHENNIPLMISVVNIAEIWYAFARRSSEGVADQSVSELGKLGIKFFDADLKLALEAARFKAQHTMSLADCFAAALAKENRADLVTGDLEFRQVEEEVRIAWLT